MAVIDAKLYALAIIGLVTTVISAYYYLRIVKIIYFDESYTPFQAVKSYSLRFTLIITSLLVLLYFVSPSILIDVTSSINLN